MTVDNTATPLVLDPAGADKHAEIRALRGRGPIARVELPGGVLAWSVTDYALLRSLLTDSRVSKDARLHWPPMVAGEVPADWVMYPWVAVRNLLSTYGADHARLRRLVAPAFTQRRTAALQPRIEAIVAELLDDIAGKPTGETVDLRAAYACPLPIRVIGELMGVPDDLGAALRACADAALDTSLDPAESQSNFIEMYRVVAELIAFKRAHPGDDLTTVLMTVHDEDGSMLDEQELTDTLLLIIIAGHETTANLLDHATVALLTHPEQRAAVTAGEIDWADVIEEALRWQAPIAHMPMRFAVEDIDLPDGLRIARGDVILATLAGAGRDPHIHGDTADEFDVRRPNKDHLTFGYGVHHCLGAPLARLEARIALPALFDRFPNLALAAAPETLAAVSSLVVNGHTSLPVRIG